MQIILQKLTTGASTVSIVNRKPFIVILQVNANLVLVGLSIDALMRQCRVA